MRNYFKETELTKTDTRLPNHPSIRLLSNKIELRFFLNILRHEIDMPITVNSAFRSSAVNKAVGGSPTSKHLDFYAADVKCSNMAKLNQILQYYKAIGVLSELIEHSTYTHFAL